MHPHFSLAEILFWNLGPDAEAAMPGHGRELLAALVTVADASMILGFGGGLVAAWFARCFWLWFVGTSVYAAWTRRLDSCMASMAVRFSGARDAD